MFTKNKSVIEYIRTFFLLLRFPLDVNQTLQIIPNLHSMNVQAGRIYTLLCRSNDPQIEPEWTFENGTVISPSTFSTQQ